MGRTAKFNRLTDIEARAYARGQGSGWLADGGGLYLRRLHTGCYWYLHLRSPESGKLQWYSLFPTDIAGAYPAKSLVDARKAAAELWAQRAQNIEPRAERERQERARRIAAEEAAARERALRNRLTVRQVFDRWREAELAPQRRADGTRTGRKDGGQWVLESFERRVFAPIGALPAAEVRKSDVLLILDAVKAKGRLRTANVLLADLKQMFRFALQREIIERNPLDGIDKKHVGGANVERDRVLDEAELQRLHAALPTSGLAPRSVAALWVILATGCRVGELMNARWSDFDLISRTWYLPVTKNQRDHTVHLSEFALAQLEHLAALRESAEWVFPNTAGTGPVCVKSLGKQLADRQRTPDRRMTNRSTQVDALSLPGGRWTAHDLRRTSATILAKLGIATDVIDECLNHKLQSKVARVYIRDRRLPQQALAFDALGARSTEGKARPAVQENQLAGVPRAPGMVVQPASGLAKRQKDAAPAGSEAHL